MINIKQISSKDIWEDFVLNQRFNSHFQSWSWGDFERNQGNKFENLGIYKKDKLVGLLPIKHVAAKRGKYLQLRHGPIFDFGDKELLNYFIDFISKKAKNEGYWFVRMSPLIPLDMEDSYSEELKGFKHCSLHNNDSELTWVLDIDKSEEELLAGMRKNTRYYIHRAERDGVEIEKTKDMKKMEEFWEIYSDTVQRQKWTAYSRDYITNEFKAFSKDDKIDMYLARYEGKYIAASLIVYYGRQAIYHHSGSLSAYSKIPASYLLQWEAIREAQERGLKWYNFWGIAPIKKVKGEYILEKGHPWEGLSFFKLGFGGEPRQFIHAKDLPVSPKYNLTRIFELVEKKSRGY
ncbi:MAG: peptidoglycan bridge formation glycyltransferase FemA/FemB family protein [Candidatus Dojkabacteria bacterium]|nr:peptidoglycan bridge formation glycyltransferase FemA/FemB family protein [Candidatus Dojkabacteria bacterium]